MDDSDLILQICAGISLFVAASIVVGSCIRYKLFKKEATLKQSPSMEELNNINLEDPSTNV